MISRVVAVGRRLNNKLIPVAKLAINFVQLPLIQETVVGVKCQDR
jgi:hypothetical protein